MSRIVAVVVAIGMVVGALYLRGRIDDDDNGGGRGSGDGGEQLVCDTVLAAACRAVSDDVVVEDAAATAERLLAGDPPPDAWLTTGPWPAIVDALRTGQVPLFGDGGEPIVSTPLALIAEPGAPATWEAAGQQVADGALSVGWRDPASGLGLLQVGAFAVGRFGGSDFATNDFDSAFRRYIEAIVDEAEVAQEPLERRLQFGRSFAEAVVSFQAEADPLLEGAAPGRRGDLRPLYPEPVVAVEAVLAGTDTVSGSLREALAEQGWNGPATSTNLPTPGVLAALWEEVRR